MVTAYYYLESELDLAYTAEQIAKEQSAGHSHSWGGISHESRQAGSAEVVTVEEVPLKGGPLPVVLTRPVGVPVEGLRAARIVINYRNWQGADGLVSLLNVLAGEPQHLGIVSALRLESVDVESLIGAEFPGPPFGAEWFSQGISYKPRALLCAPIKPSAGLSADEAGKLAFQAALGGATIIKDDELAFSTRRTPSVDRAREVAQQVRRAEQAAGERKIYVANAIGSGHDLIERARLLLQAGADALLVAPSLQGQDVVSTLRRSGILCPMVAHNSFQTNSSRLSTFGISLQLWIILQRLSGADAAVIPSSFGSFGFGAEETSSVLQGCVREMNGKKSSLPMHSGSVSVINADDLISLDEGTLTALTSGTGIFDHPLGAEAGAQAIRAIIDPEWKRRSAQPERLEHSIKVAKEVGRSWITVTQMYPS